MTDFLEIYDNALSEVHCEQFIEKFNKSPHKQAGRVGHGVDVTKKDSIDIQITSYKDWQKENIIIQNATLAGLVRYMRKFPFMLVGAVSTSIQDPVTGKVRVITHEDIAQMNDENLAGLIRYIYRLGAINIQLYKKSQGGYHHWHSEVYPHPNDSNQDSLHRVLLFSFYLNDIVEGGETEFFYQQKKIRPKAGRMIIAPAGFTHTHRGNIPLSSDKYFLTSWVLFQPAQHLYQRPD